MVPFLGPSPPLGSEKVSVRPPVVFCASACHRSTLACNCARQKSATAFPSPTSSARRAMTSMASCTYGSLASIRPADSFELNSIRLSRTSATSSPASPRWSAPGENDVTDSGSTCL